MIDKIDEIRARHEVDAKIATVLNPQLPPTWTLAGWRAHDDRAWLLAEDARHRAEIEKLTHELDEARAALQPFAAEAQRYDPDDGDDFHPAWNSRFQIKHIRAARKAL